jgi:DNA-3-methyladenine glycosylase II
MAGVSLADATKEVARRDRVLAKAIARLGPLEHSPRDPDGPFRALARAIVYQWLAGRAALAIYTRVRATVGPALTPQSLAAASDARLRRAGLSANELASLRGLAAKVSDATVALTRSSVRSDDERSSDSQSCAASDRGRRRCTCSFSCVDSTSGRSATSACAMATH